MLFKVLSKYPHIVFPWDLSDEDYEKIYNITDKKYIGEDGSILDKIPAYRDLSNNTLVQFSYPWDDSLPKNYFFFPSLRVAGDLDDIKKYFSNYVPTHEIQSHLNYFIINSDNFKNVPYKDFYFHDINRIERWKIAQWKLLEKFKKT